MKIFLSIPAVFRFCTQKFDIWGFQIISLQNFLDKNTYNYVIHSNFVLKIQVFPKSALLAANKMPHHKCSSCIGNDKHDNTCCQPGCGKYREQD